MLATSTAPELSVVARKTRAAYNLAADRYDRLFANEVREKAYDRALLDALVDRLPPNGLVLDAGCGPSAQMSRYLADRHVRVVGADIADRCVFLARRHNPDVRIHQADIASLPYRDQQFDAVISFYSVIDTPRAHVQQLFDEMARVTQRGGCLVIAVKAGTTEGWTGDLLGIPAEIFFSTFLEPEIEACLERSGCEVERLERRPPYAFEIASDRIYALATKRTPSL